MMERGNKMEMQNQQQKIQNPKIQVPETPQMNDRDFIQDMLATEKYMTTSYAVALNEISIDPLRRDLQNILTETQNAQRDIFLKMFQKGWYSLEAADQQKIQQSYQQHQSYSSQFPYNNPSQ
ncbi:hypothetical protein HMPREF1015_01111 [Bacillus smithii 7_3_47FAA]|jgi:spore coat protein CotF|uniref:Coat F domain-containing protein n=2 Tax=Bacillaceae TaxID=186817 RepID=G9QH52_9BACI|nr:hypothetical protein HMPREF1015_01111 [Bacillus smithii 7_3_47FAA]